MVTVQGHTVAFRHELARRAVLDAVPAARRRVLHREVAYALVTSGADPARVVHHAEAGGDLELLVEQALLAARQASSVSAHREAWSHYQRVVPLLRLIEGEHHAEVLEAASHEAYAAGDADGRARRSPSTPSTSIGGPATTSPRVGCTAGCRASTGTRGAACSPRCRRSWR